jgi:hypothetical protein
VELTGTIDISVKQASLGALGGLGEEHIVVFEEVVDQSIDDGGKCQR